MYGGHGIQEVSGASEGCCKLADGLLMGGILGVEIEPSHVDIGMTNDMVLDRNCEFITLLESAIAFFDRISR